MTITGELRESRGLLNCPLCGVLFQEARIGNPWWECRNRECQNFGIPSQIHVWPTADDRAEPSTEGEPE